MPVTQPIAHRRRGLSLLLTGRLGAPWDQVLRWRLRKLLALAPGPNPARRNPEAPLRIGYLFTGTYGDFAQCLPALRRLALAYPGAEIILSGADFAREFVSELPRSIRPARRREPLAWLFRPLDILLTNAVGVFRVRFDLMARFCARRAYGFRHEHEARRGGYWRSVKLDTSVKSFAEENLRLLDVAGVPAAAGLGPGCGREAPEEAAYAAAPAEKWGKGRVLFHIGSAGLKRDFGLRAYARLVVGILGDLRKGDVPAEVVMGPGDEDVALEVRSGSDLVPQMFPVSGLIRRLRGFEGTVLCFNSFLAHLCLYLDKPALVIHRGAVPYGYDCSPLHRQIVLVEDGKDVAAVMEAVRGAMS
jgi:ADP-heptose:LPS heptosyltransferase